MEKRKLYVKKKKKLINKNTRENTPHALYYNQKVAIDVVRGFSCIREQNIWYFRR